MNTNECVYIDIYIDIYIYQKSCLQLQVVMYICTSILHYCLTLYYNYDTVHLSAFLLSSLHISET